MRQLPTLTTHTISHDDRQNSIHWCYSFYLPTTLKRHKLHLINILFIARQAKESDQQQWSDETYTWWTNTNSQTYRQCIYTTTQGKKKNVLWNWPSEDKMCPPLGSIQKVAHLNSECLTHWKISVVTRVISNPFCTCYCKTWTSLTSAAYVVCPKSKCTDFLFQCPLDSPEITSYLLQSMTLGKLHSGSNVFSTDHRSTGSHFP